MPPSGALCGKVFEEGTEPAPNLFITYSFCKANCGSFRRSKPRVVDEWAAPLVQFVLPSIIFSMSVPQRNGYLPKEILKRPRRQQRWTKYPSKLLRAILGLLIVIMDTLLWIGAILVYAGPMMLSGLHESVLDYKILKAVLKPKTEIPIPQNTKLYMLLTVISGNLVLAEGQPNTRILDVLSLCPAAATPAAPMLCMHCTTTNKKERLRSLMTSQNSFGATIAAPVIFYLGAFAYTIIDLLGKPSDQDAAISLAFGVEWMVVVHVAIVSGCLLASNNPSSVSVLVGNARVLPALQVSSPWWRKQWCPDVYDTMFQPVAIWERGSNKKKWLSAHAWGDPAIHDSVQMGCVTWPLIWVFTLILIGLPPAAGAVVAWQTPPVGWGCRSLSFVCYAACQVMVIVFWLLKEKYPVQISSNLRTGRYTMPWRLWDTFVNNLLGCCVSLCYKILIGLSLLTVLGGTLMQIIGVYRNCLCYTNAQWWLKLDQARVDVASDTYDQRHSSQNWIVMGCFATGFMALCCYGGWLYQRYIRDRYKGAIEELI
ncbi:hypothetical protein B0O99DRAFT_704928 [Bisporella sp. PMI_857]|nr:hypothetical protein B0O99DRAFT_704928 [Bisporella sp. PMI_857]